MGGRRCHHRRLWLWRTAQWNRGSRCNYIRSKLIICIGWNTWNAGHGWWTLTTIARSSANHFDTCPMLWSVGYGNNETEHTVFDHWTRRLDRHLTTQFMHFYQFVNVTVGQKSTMIGIGQAESVNREKGNGKDTKRIVGKNWNFNESKIEFVNPVKVQRSANMSA